jgi:hypothetical protein
MSNLRVSSVGGSCLKKIQLEYKGAEPTYSDYILKAFEDGNMHEPSVIRWFEQKYNTTVGFKGENQLTLRINDYLTGHPDGYIPNLPDDKNSYLLECKALRQRAIFELRAQGLQKSHPHYYTQVQIYMYGMLKEGYPLIGCYFVARNKEKFVNGEYDTYVEIVPYNEEFVEATLQEVEQKYAVAIGEDIEPPMHPNDNWECRYCGYLHICHPLWSPPKKESTIKDLDLESKIVRLKEIQIQRQLLEAEEKELKEAVLSATSVGTTNISNYIVKVTEVRSERLDTKAIKSFIPPDKFSQFVKQSTYKRLTISEVEEEL